MEKPERTMKINIQIEADSWENIIEAVSAAAICLRGQPAITSLNCETHSYDYRMNAWPNYTAIIGNDDYQRQHQGFLKKMKSTLGD